MPMMGFPHQPGQGLWTSIQIVAPTAGISGLTAIDCMENMVGSAAILPVLRVAGDDAQPRLMVSYMFNFRCVGRAPTLWCIVRVSLCFLDRTTQECWEKIEHILIGIGKPTNIMVAGVLIALPIAHELSTMVAVVFTSGMVGTVVISLV